MMPLPRRTVLTSGLAAALVPAIAIAETIQLFDDDMIKGQHDAPVTLIEYGSASCSHCAEWSLDVLPQLDKQYIKPGKLRLVFREILTQPAALAAAIYAMARSVPKAQYFAVLEEGYRLQSSFFMDDADVGNLFARIGAVGGLAPARISQLLADDAVLVQINERCQRNATHGRVAASPTFVIGGETLKGAQPFRVLAEKIDHALSPNRT